MSLSLVKKFGNSYGSTVNAATQITMYAQTVVRQQDVTISEVPNLPQHQEKARNHAQTWLKEIWPSILDVSHDIIGYAQIFDSAYIELNNLVSRLEKGDSDAKEQFKTILNVVLLPGFQKASISKIAESMNIFLESLQTDAKNFESDSEMAKKAYIKESGALAELQTKEEAAQTRVHSLHIAIIAAAATLATLIAALAVVSIFTFGIGSGALAAGVVAATATETALSASYAEAVQTEHNLQTQIEQEQHELAMLNSVQNQLNGFTQSTSQTSTAAQSVADGWAALGDDLDNLIQQLDKITPEEAAIIIRTQLYAAYQDWKVVVSLAKVLKPSNQIPVKEYKDMKAFLNDITPKK